MFLVVIWLQLALFTSLQKDVNAVIEIMCTKDAKNGVKKGEPVTFTDEVQHGGNDAGATASMWEAIFNGNPVAIKITLTIAEDNYFINEEEVYEVLDAFVDPAEKNEGVAEKAGIIPIYFVGIVVKGGKSIIGRRVIVMKLLNQTDLHKEYIGAGEKPDPMEMRRIAASVMRTIIYMHSKLVWHGDIKPENILFARVESIDNFGFRTTKIYVGDMGLARITKEGEPFKKQKDDPCGTVMYMSWNVHNMSTKAVLAQAAKPEWTDDIDMLATALFFVRFHYTPWGILAVQYDEVWEKIIKNEPDPGQTLEDMKKEKDSLFDEIRNEKETFPMKIPEAFKDGKATQTCKLLMGMYAYARTLTMPADIYVPLSEQEIADLWENDYQKLYRNAVFKATNKTMPSFDDAGNSGGCEKNNLFTFENDADIANESVGLVSGRSSRKCNCTIL